MLIYFLEKQKARSATATVVAACCRYCSFYAFLLSWKKFKCAQANKKKFQLIQ